MGKYRFAALAGLAACVVLLGGCEETATKQVAVRPPAPTPVRILDFSRQPLPFPDQLAYSTWPEPLPAIDALVEQVQASYDAGQLASKEKDFDKADEDFNRATNLLLASGFEADSDPRLSKLVDQLGEVVQSDELAAAKGAEEQESETPAEPAPIDEIADLTLPAGDPRLAQKAEKELLSVRHDLPLTINDSVLQYLSFFTTTRGRAIVEHGLERGGRYDGMIRRVLQQEGVPQDLIYLAQAESAFQPQAVSRAGARGIWQFMPYRGEEYDLERNYWIDERSDPEKATHAAARHLRDLYGMFGDWYLVMAAYNSGPLNVAKGIERTGYADFWELKKRNVLPKQTQNYVPIILALALVAKDPAAYGVHVSPEQPPVEEPVKLSHPINLGLAADAAGVDVDDIRAINPELLRNVTPNEDGFQLALPVGTVKNFEMNVAQVPEDKWTSWRLHTVEEGETLSDIARHYRVTVPAIVAANHLEAHATMPAGFLMNVPTPPPVVRLVHYRVRRGDSLEGIADRYDVTVAELKRWNHITGNRAPRGARLRIYAGSGMAAATTSKGKPAQSSSPSAANTPTQVPEKSAPVAHKVEPGETLYSIARQYQTTVSALRESNPFLTGRPLQVGDILTILQ